ncbi:hypothetical protein [Pedosphaera parvula]|uniref:Uncharacterized protein n=1 Tax=Pedosphaera parvula (strain Ellin514) TaxID=320771 RepID=B9XL24_PEDPL|nr:hypothetical protein [Pedosphaera parvula]EEF59518.1 hypothetical protein Cflav_PD2362 [Pedosphaera parvula Ellin514]
MTRVILLALLATALTACKKHEAVPSPQAVTQDQPASAPQEGTSARGPNPLPAAPVTVNAPENGDVNATLGQLSLELRKYVVRTRSAPKSFEEFAEKAQLQAPTPPAGKKYAIQGGKIALVNAK